MRKILIVAAFSLPFLGLQAESSLSDILGKYERVGTNSECSLSFAKESNYSRIEITGSEMRKGLKLYFQAPEVSTMGNITIVEEHDYNGNATAYFIEAQYQLKVILTWEDNENGVDQSTFCELSKKN